MSLLNYKYAKKILQIVDIVHTFVTPSSYLRDFIPLDSVRESKEYHPVNILE